jgi:acylaminoacyl-peptidase
MPNIPLIPRKLLFGNPRRTQVKLSPDGRWLTWLAPFDGLLNVWIAPADDVAAEEPLTRVAGTPIAWQDWQGDGEHVLFMNDDNGDENWRVFAVDRRTAAIHDLTPMSDVNAQVLMISPRRPSTVLLGLNDRDKRWHDVWAVEVATAERTLVFENTEEFWHFTFDWCLRPRLARKSRPQSGGSRLCLLADRRSEPWLDIPYADEMTTWPLFFNASGDAFAMMSSLGRDRAALVSVDVVTRTETVLAEHDQADVGANHIWNPISYRIDAAAAIYLRQEWIALNPTIERDLKRLRETFNNGDFSVASQSSDNQRWIVATDDVERPGDYFLYDRSHGSVSLLFNSRPDLKKFTLAPMRPNVIKARDGLDLVSYLTLPPDAQPSPVEPLPMVLVVHGGPWDRDHYEYRGDHQWLANRGYAVLSVNYRASSGFGKSFVNAGAREHGSKIHADLIDAVEWAIGRGIARRDKIAIMGASYGGYAALVGLTFTPRVFCCGVSLAGFSNLVTLLENMPPYWAGFDEFMFRSYADVRTSEGREWLASRSPLFRVDQICRPLLIVHGANDVRCKLLESEQIVSAMRARGLGAIYVVYPNEGHAFRHPASRTSFAAICEAFLAKHLGGRCEQIDDDLTGAEFSILNGVEQITELQRLLGDDHLDGGSAP